MKRQILLFTVMILGLAFPVSSRQKTAIRIPNYTGGGLCLKQNGWISMVSEHLFISKGKVRAEYKLTNESNKAVRVEMEFPIPISPQVPSPSVLP